MGVKEDADEVIRQADKATEKADASAGDHAAKANSATDNQTKEDEERLAKAARIRAAAARKAKEEAEKAKNTNDQTAAGAELAKAKSDLAKATLRDQIFATFPGETDKDLDEKLLELVDLAKNWLANNPNKTLKDWPPDECRRKAGANLTKLGITSPQNPNPDKEKELAAFLRQLVEIEGGW